MSDHATWVCLLADEMAALERILTHAEVTDDAQADVAKIRDRIATFTADDAKDPAFRGAAEDALRHRSDEFDADDNAVVSRSDDGAYVMCWVWVPNEDVGLCTECGEPADNGEGYDGLCGNCADRAEAAE